MKSKLVKFEPDLLAKIVRAAQKRNIKASQFIRDACREKLQREAPQKQAVQE